MLNEAPKRAAKTRRIKTQPVKFGAAKKRGVRTQFGALCYRRRNDKIEVMLVTSRRSKRWIVPKGWPQDGATPEEAALTEAWEEGGVVGKARSTVVGLYTYQKQIAQKSLPCVVAVYAVKVKQLKTRYPEAKERKRKWFSRKKAAKLVHEPELSQIIKSFDPKYI